VAVMLVSLAGCGRGADTPPPTDCASVQRTWTQHAGGAGDIKPPGVWNAAMAADVGRGEVLLYGGFLAEPLGRSNQAWSWDGLTGTWTNRTPSTT